MSVSHLQLSTLLLLFHILLLSSSFHVSGHYTERSMPNGGFDFVQSFVCNLNNECVPQDEGKDGNEIPKAGQG